MSWPETRVVNVVRVLDARREEGVRGSANCEGDARGGGVGVKDALVVFGADCIELGDTLEVEEDADAEDEEDDCEALM